MEGLASIPQAKKRQVMKKPVPKIVKQRPPSIKLYRRIAISFVILTILLLALVAYLSFSQVSIKIYPKAQDINTEFIVSIVETPSIEREVEGRVYEQFFEKTKEFKATGQTTTIEGKAGGEVTIINKYSQDQPLIATTRLLSSGGVLFRLVDSVTVPAGGQVKAMVQADETGKQGETGPSRFTIPGLWQGLQEQIYAESDQAMTGGVKEVSLISGEDLNNAEQELSKEILEQAESVMKDQVVDPRLDGYTFSGEIDEKVSDTMPGEEKDSFNVKIKLKVVAVFFNSVQMDEIMMAKLEEVMDQDFRLGKILDEETSYTMNRYDLEKNAANLTVYTRAQSIVKESSGQLDKSNIAGLSLGAAQAYLENLSSVERVEISVRPFWIKIIPRLEDHIEYETIY